MQHPIQRLLYVSEINTLYTCTGPHIHSFNARTGEPLAKWTAPAAVRQVKKKKGKNKGKGDNVTGKKRKSGDEGGEEGEEEMKDSGEEARAGEEEEVEGEGGEGSGNNNSSKIISAQAGKYIVAVTSEDKTVRVLDGSGLGELSSRTMPKRPCALALTDSDNTVLVADKFGDVYSLPLLPPEPAPAMSHTATLKDSESKRHRTEITHDLPFAHKLLLGHVSMLTDLLSLTTTTQEGQKRKYMITADRDEHIRVSRYPQSWVIEGFCLGHTAFVSRLLVPGWAPQEVLSGGGDGWLGRWRWADGKCLQKVEVARVLEEVVGRRVAGGKEGGGSSGGGSKEGVEGPGGRDKNREEGAKPAVVGIWEVPERRIIIVAFERIPALLLFITTTPDQALTYHTTIPLPGNPLDLTVDPSSSSFWVSLAPCSTTSSECPLLQHVTLTANNEWENTTKDNQAARMVSEEISKVCYVGDVKILNEGLLYTTGLLRKGFGKGKE